MSIIVVGKNSSVYSLIKPSLTKDIMLAELESAQALTWPLAIEKSAKQTFIVFSGVVSQDIELLQKIELFHNLLARRFSIATDPNVILISSSAVYGKYKCNFAETDDCRPISNYGRSKFQIEQIYTKLLNSNVSILRLGNVLGLDTVAKTFSKNSERERYLDCRCDYSTAMRTYVDAEILSDVIKCYIYKHEDLPQILNVGREKPQSVSDIVNELGMNFKLRISDNAVQDLILDTSTLFQIIESEGN